MDIVILHTGERQTCPKVPRIRLIRINQARTFEDFEGAAMPKGLAPGPKRRFSVFIPDDADEPLILSLAIW